MVEGGIDKYGLYQQFADNRQRSSMMRVVPSGLATAVGSAPIFATTVNESARNAFNEAVQRHPQESIIFLTAYMTAAGITGIGVLINLLDITRAESPNGKLAQHIAELEGRDPQTPEEIVREIRRTKSVVKTADEVGPSQDLLLNEKLRHAFSKLQIRKHPEDVEERAVKDRQTRKFTVKYAGRTESGYPIDPQILTTALLLADRQWEAYAGNEKHPAYLRRYGALMREDIQRRLGEHLRGIPEDRAAMRLSYETMTPQELGRELLSLINQFPLKKSALEYTKDFYREMASDEPAPIVDDSEWYQRDKSEEKKVVMAKLRRLIARVPSPRSFHEILLRELSFLYNAGLEVRDNSLSKEEEIDLLYDWLIDREHFNINDIQSHTAIVPVFNEPLLTALGLSPDPEHANLGKLFNPTCIQEVQRGMYELVKDKFKLKATWNPHHYDKDEIQSPVKRWMANRKEDTLTAFIYLEDTVFDRIHHSTPIEETWKREYQRAYKEKLSEK